MNTTELERSYTFPYESVTYLRDFIGFEVEDTQFDIEDNYINKNLRIRKIHKIGSNVHDIELTQKIGNKQNGSRIEKRCLIYSDAANILLSNTKLKIITSSIMVYPQFFVRI